MLRIPTFLRDAFERPPEREGREVWFAKKREIPPSEGGDEPDGPPTPDSSREDSTNSQRDNFHERELGIIHNDEEPVEPAEEDGGDDREPPEEGINGGEESREEAPRIRIKAEILIEKAKSALETIAKIKAILGNREFMDKIREAAKRDRKVKDLLTSFEEDAGVLDDTEKTVQNLKSEAEQFVLWQDPKERKLSPNELAAANVRSRCIVLKPNSEEEEEAERQLQRSVNDYLNDPAVVDSNARWDALSIEEKSPMIERLEELTHIDETLENMDETLTGYDTGLKIYLKQIQQLRDDLEKKGEISPPQQEWGGGNGLFSLRLIHFVHLAMAVKKIYDTWKKQWEYDFERAVGECAAAISPWVAPREVTQRLLEEEEANIRKVKEEKKKEYEKYSFGELHHAILTPHPDPAEKMAQLEVAAEKGWLYGITEEGSTLTVFGQPLNNFVPRSWHKNPSLIAEYHRKLQSLNINGESTKKKEGAASGSRNKGTPQSLIDIRNIILVEKDYFKAVGMIEWAFKDKVDIGEIGGSLFATILECIAIDPLFAKVIHSYPDILKETGKIAGGYPSQILFFLKIRSATLQKLAKIAEQKGGINLNDPTVLRELEDRFQDEPIISTYFHIRRDILEKGNVRREEIYAKDLATIPAGDIPDEVALNRAIGKVMECQTITTTTGEKIDIADDTYTNYRNAIEAGDPGMTWRLDMKPGMDESYGRPNSFSLMKDAYLRQLFVVNTNGEVTGTTYASNTIKNIAERYYDLRQLAQAYPRYKRWLENFVRDTQKRFCSTQGPGYAMFTHDRFHDVEQLTFTDKEGKSYGIRNLITAGIITKKDLEYWIAATPRPAPAASKLLAEINSGRIPIDPPL
ncbi:hypothetical protein HYS30_03435 [Candidatus Peregrinibacteria bacterium]|nr:hypothetical protein [Candidatus Peregrinibacteria bacterium]MBI2524069.1 hypothetical protein [Candidatus Peregrinibacteria bacterium]